MFSGTWSRLGTSDTCTALRAMGEEIYGRDWFGEKDQSPWRGVLTFHGGNGNSEKMKDGNGNGVFVSGIPIRWRVGLFPLGSREVVEGKEERNRDGIFHSH